MTATRRALLLGDLNWAKAAVDKLEQDFGLVHVPTGTRQGFIDDCKSGKYDGVEAILRHYHSAKDITGRLDRELIQALPSSVKYICSHASGYEIIEVSACTERNIAVANTPRVVDAATADMVLFLILGALRRAWIPQSSLRAGVWTKGVPFGHDPKDKVLGILGLGGVGIATAQRAVPFGFKLQYHNRRPVEGLEKHFAAENVPKFVSLDELLTTSDIVSLHLPLNESTRHCISTEQIAKMKDGVIIINTARGGVLDEKALISALDAGKVWSAGLDVFEGEPEVLPELRSHPSVMMLPHLGTVTIETQVAMETLVVDNARAGLETGQLLTQVPEQCSPAKGLI